MVGSLSCRFINTVERLLPGWDDWRFLTIELLELRLESSCWSPALTAAAACRDVDADREEGEGLRMPSLDVMLRVIFGDPEVDLDLEGGREFKSGAIVIRFMVQDRSVG